MSALNSRVHHCKRQWRNLATNDCALDSRLVAQPLATRCNYSEYPWGVYVSTLSKVRPHCSSSWGSQKRRTAMSFRQEFKLSLEMDLGEKMPIQMGCQLTNWHFQPVDRVDRLIEISLMTQQVREDTRASKSRNEEEDEEAVLLPWGERVPHWRQKLLQWLWPWRRPW